MNISAILSASSINPSMIAELLLKSFSAEQTKEDVNMEKVKESIKLVKMLNEIPRAHNIISDFHMEEIRKVENAMEIFHDCEFSAEHINRLEHITDNAINSMENELKSKLSNLIKDNGFELLAKLSGLGNLLG